MTLKIRPATKADSQHLTPLINDFVRYLHNLEEKKNTSNPPPGADQIVANIFAPDLGVNILAAENDKGHIIGFLCYHLTFWVENNRPGAFVTAISVGKKYRHQGVGHALLERALKNIGQRGGEQVMITVHTSNKKAIEFYKSLGGDFYKTEKLILMPTDNTKKSA